MVLFVCVELLLRLMGPMCAIFQPHPPFLWVTYSTRLNHACATLFPVGLHCFARLLRSVPLIYSPFRCPLRSLLVVLENQVIKPKRSENVGHRIFGFPLPVCVCGFVLNVAVLRFNAFRFSSCHTVPCRGCAYFWCDRFILSGVHH